MSEPWLACPHCDLSFSSEANYKMHFEAEHKGRKSKKVARINSETDQF